MNILHARIACGSAAPVADRSFENPDDFQDLRSSPRYCPTGLLASFALLMAGHGRCVITDMMLGDREYAMWQLACARAMDDDELDVVAARLYSYFDDPLLQQAMTVLGTA